jgi:F-type H+-transporting ATPase subunit k
VSSPIRGRLFIGLFGHSVILGRAIKTEYLALGTLLGTVGLSMGLTGGSKDAKPKTIEQAKESVGLNASSK